MSNEEKKRRANYRKIRQILIIVQIVLIGLVSVLTVSSFGLFLRLNKIMYIDYEETSDIDYKVYLKANDMFDEEYLGKDVAYVASLIDYIDATFNYTLEMNANNLNYEYVYWIDATVEVVDKKSSATIFKPCERLVGGATLTQNSNNELVINENIKVDYDKYNEIANNFVVQYDLDDTINTLILKMHINVISSCEDFETNGNNSYEVLLRVPLTTKVVNIEMNSTIPNEQTKVLACERGIGKQFFKASSITFGIIDVLFVIGFILFTYLTRNTDINYSIKVKRIVNSYKSYIQRITNEFDTHEYQLLNVSTFNEMLDIRDTIQSPILMFENEDKTCTTFVIPTNTKLLYSFEIKVDDFDEIYGEQTILEPTQVEVAKEESKKRVEEEIKVCEEQKNSKKEEERARLENEEKIKKLAEEEEKQRMEELSRIKAEEEAKQKAEEEARLKAEEEARLKAEEEARLKAEEEARLKAEEEARLKAEEEARLKAEEEARLKAEEEARKIIEELHRDEVSAEEVVDIVSDETAEVLIETEVIEEKITGTKKTIVNLDTISKNYIKEDTVTVNSLKEKKLIDKNAYFVKVLARGVLDKPLVVKAHDFSIDAAKMIELTGGRVIKLKSKK